MVKVPYQKQPTTYDEQVAKLASRGMVIADAAKAAQLLHDINYYRFGAYWLGFEHDHATHQFKAGTTFEQVVMLYEFDRALRLMVLDAIERFEVSARAQWTYHMSHKYGAHAHTIEGVHERTLWARNIDDLRKETQRADEVFIDHLTQKYAEALPPIWAVSEVMSFGLLSRWYKSLRVNSVRKAIAARYQVYPDVLESWLQHFTVVRNNCAHHSRLWNRWFDRVALMIPKRHAVLEGEFFAPKNKLYNSLLVLAFLMRTITGDDSWKQSLLTLIDANLTVPLADMGFPENWRTMAIWN